MSTVRKRCRAGSATGWIKSVGSTGSVALTPRTRLAPSQLCPERLHFGIGRPREFPPDLRDHRGFFVTDRFVVPDEEPRGLQGRAIGDRFVCRRRWRSRSFCRTKTPPRLCGGDAPDSKSGVRRGQGERSRLRASFAIGSSRWPSTLFATAMDRARAGVTRATPSASFTAAARPSRRRPCREPSYRSRSSGRSSTLSAASRAWP